jgi:hypothetical protein
MAEKQMTFPRALRVAVLALAMSSAGARAEDIGAGNPVAAVPLNSLSATRDRPLFSPSRRPPPPAAAVAEPTPAAADAPAVAQGPEGPPFTLMGTLLGPDARIGIFMNERTRQSARIREGATDSGWTLVSIDSRTAVMRSDGQQPVTLALPDKPTAGPISLVAVKGLGINLGDSPADDVSLSADPRPPRPQNRRGFAQH